MKAAGELSVDAVMEEEESMSSTTEDDPPEADPAETNNAVSQHVDNTSVPAVNIEEYIPLIGSDRRWTLSEIDLGDVPIIHRPCNSLIYTEQSGLPRDVAFSGREVVARRTHHSSSLARCYARGNVSRYVQCCQYRY